MASIELRRLAKDFVSIRDLAPADLVALLDLAARLKAERVLRHRAPTATALAGLHVATLFEKPSLRTRATFEIGVRELGGDILDLPAPFADGVREPLPDVARNLERWADALVVRTYAQSKVTTLAEAAPRLHVINALTDEEHPCQALADMLTVREHWENCRGRTIAFIGDGNNTATSLTHAALMLGINVHLAAPEGFELASRIVEDAMRTARDGASVRQFRDPREAVARADAVYTDVCTSMGFEHEATKRAPIFKPFQVNEALMAHAHQDAVFMHCLPAHRNAEVTDAVLDGPQSVVFDQAENRLHTQKALLVMLLS